MKGKFKRTNYTLKIFLILGLLLTFSPIAAAQATVTEVVYSDGSIDTNEFFVMASSSAQIITSSPFEITENGTYQLSSSFTGRITIENTATNVNIIGSGSQNLDTHIVVQGSRTGPLSITIDNLNIRAPLEVHGIDFGSAGIFSNNLYISGENIVDRDIMKTDNYGAGIHVPNGVKLVIDKAEDASVGRLSARGSGRCAGIGGGDRGSGGNININGGIVIARGHSNGTGAGIGGGANGSGGEITITGGEVIASSGGYGSGLGGGSGGNGGKITISGGIVNATGSWQGGAGIGGGGNSSNNSGAGGEITISGGTVTARSASNGGASGGAGIGGGGGWPAAVHGPGGNIIITGENTVVNATSYGNGKDIGSGYNNTDGGTLIVDGSATLNLNEKGLNVDETPFNFITCTIGGAGAGLHSGAYLNRQKLITLTDFTIEPNEEADAFDSVSFEVKVEGLSYDDQTGHISFKGNGNEIGTAPIMREGEISWGIASINKNDLYGGTYNLISTYVEGNADNYYSTGELAITNYVINKLNQASLEISIPGHITYGDAPFNIMVSGGSGTGELSFEVTTGDAVTVDASGNVAIVGAGFAEITVTKGGDNYYNQASEAVEIVITKATPPEIVFPTATDIIYGQILWHSELTGGLGDGNFAWQYPDTIPPLQNEGYTVVFAPNDMDNYDYSGVVLGQNINVNVLKQPLTIKAVNKSKVYGGLDPELTYNITTGSLVGDDILNGEVTREAGENVDIYTIDQGTLTGGDNYEITFVGAEFTITPKALTIKADVQSKIYGVTDPELIYEITAGELVGSDQITGDLTRAAGEDVGDYEIQQGTITAGDNYDITYVGAHLTITKKALTITADVQTKTYGDADPELTFDITAGELVGSDQITGDLTRAPGEDVGDYAIIEQEGSLTAGDNYNITYVGADLTITKKVLTITADAQNKTYGDADPELTFDITEGELVGSDQITGDLTRAAGENVDDYEIEQGTITAGDNYNITYVGADLTITKKALTITADVQTKTYGDADPELTFDITEGELIGSDQITGALTRAPGENVDNYVIEQGTITAGDNYDIEFEGLFLTIERKALIITAENKSKVFGADDPKFTISYDGFEFEDDASSLGGELSFIRALGEDVGTYAITPTGLTSDNYNITFIDGTLTVSRPSRNRILAPISELEKKEDGSVIIIKEAQLDEENNSFQVTITQKELQDTMNLLDSTENTTGTIRIEIQGNSSIVSNTLQLPVSSLSKETHDYDVVVFSKIGELVLPSNMLDSTTGGDSSYVQLTIAYGDKEILDFETRGIIGDRPLLQLSIAVDGEQISWNNPQAPVTISIPYTPTAEELADPEHITVWYIDGSGNASSVPTGRYNSETGMVSFTTTHFSHFAVVYVRKTFNDIANYNWSKKEIEVLASKGILKGISENEYAPSVNITRADFLYNLVRTLGVDAKDDGNFEDISSDAYYYREIGIAKKLGISNGTGHNQFNPDESISRQDMMVLTERALRMFKKLNQQGISSGLERFTDKALISSYAVDSVATVIGEELIVGNHDQVNPLGNTTRAEAAVFLYRIYHKY